MVEINEAKETMPKVKTSLKAKVTSEEAAKRMDKFIVPLGYGITLTKFTEVIGYTGGDVRTLRKTLAENNMALVEYQGRQYIKYGDAMMILETIYGERPITAKDADTLMKLIFNDSPEAEQ